ncbi:uncharacterized protein LOC130612790 [Hydractinia symbiolongicarpus]|uniref:uncharacterized protein LOC130612790 n=1 Tax=Hydractinia symbiolongicarpus TaxID=13093 RepID=UPI002550EDC5|nr:uncharacterized protein LOC130612790 [Hydractinia symbiolongicarpus]
MNIKTLAYIKRCSKQKGSRNLQLTNRYLKENNLVALPFDKGIGIYIMKVETYNNKMSEITDLPQFEKLVGRRKNKKHPMLKEEERVLSMLKLLKEDNKISDALYDKMKPVGSQPPRLYGLAKVHKKDTPVRPVLSMPGSAYYKIGNQVSKWLSVVKECNINSSTKEISDLLSQIQLNTNEELVSFDIKSLYTNVPLDEAINDCTELLFSDKYEQPPVDKETFKTLVSLCSRDVVLLSHDGYYKQIDGLAMGSPPAPLLANGWLSKFDSILKDDAVLYSRHMDDVLRNIERNRIDEKLLQINDLHPSLKFTIEKEGKNTSIPFLDMLIIRSNNNLSSTWYTKATDTGLTMNFHSLAPRKYKRSVVSGLVHRIHRACSTWSNFHQSLEKGKTVLEKNQYPKAFYDPIIKSTISKIMENNDNENPDEENEKEESEEKMIFIQYRGRVSEKFETSMRKLNIPCKIIFTLKKLKSSLPPLKPVIEKCLKSCLVYKIKCPRCNSCYVGQTSRHLIKRLKEHKRTGPVGKHFDDCNNLLTMENVSILCSSTRNVYHLMTLEALIINYIKPIFLSEDG